MVHRIVTSIFVFLSLAGAQAQGAEFRVICGGAGAAGQPSDVSRSAGELAKEVGMSITSQLQEIAKTRTILEVSLSSTSSGTSVGTSGNYWGGATTDFACVTVKIQ
jgi:hypothetical protein